MLQASLFRISPLALLLVLAACDTGEGTSLYDPNRATSPDPTVASISPDGNALAGIDEITITGSNFSPNADENLVFFGEASARVLSASPTELRVAAPNTPRENLPVRVAVRSAANYSAPVAYTLVSALTPFGELARGDEPFGMASDASGLLYASLTIDGQATGIFQIPQPDERTLYHEDRASTWPDITLGPDGAVYGVRNNRGVYRLPAGAPSTVFAALPNGVSLTAIGASPSGDLWVGGSNSDLASSALYRIGADATVTPFSFPKIVRDLVILGDALYAATQTSGLAEVWRFPLDASGALGGGTLYYDLTAELGPGTIVFAIEAAADGTLFVGTNAADPVRLIAPDGTASALYPGVLRPPASEFAWGAGSTLYMGQARIAATEVTQAQDAQLYQVITRYERRP